MLRNTRGPSVGSQGLNGCAGGADLLLDDSDGPLYMRTHGGRQTCRGSETDPTRRGISGANAEGFQRVGRPSAKSGAHGPMRGSASASHRVQPCPLAQ
jgi:hypothetical protein